MFKPDAISRGLQGVLMAEWQHAGFVIEDLSYYSAATVKFWRMHYAEHQHQPWFEQLIRAMGNRPIMVLIVYQPSVSRATAIHNARQFMQTQRTKYGLNNPNNTVHVSDSEEAAVREARIWIYGIKADEVLPPDEADDEEIEEANRSGGA
jgi:nucleoside diphosphate kinase